MVCRGGLQSTLKYSPTLKTSVRKSHLSIRAMQSPQKAPPAKIWQNIDGKRNRQSNHVGSTASVQDDEGAEETILKPSGATRARADFRPFPPLRLSRSRSRPAQNLQASEISRPADHWSD